MQVDLSNPLKQLDLATILDMSDRNLREVLTAGGLDSQVVPAINVIHFYIKRLREQAAGRDDTLGAARTRETMAKAKLAEIELGERLGQIIFSADVVTLLCGFMIEIQEQVLQAGDRVSQAIETKYGIQLDDAVVQDELRGALGASAKRQGELVESLVDSIIEADTEAAQTLCSMD